MIKVLLVGGGTGGHINPALAIVSVIKEHIPDAVFLFAGNPTGMEAKLIPAAGYDFAPIKINGFQRKLTIKNIGRNIKAACYLSLSARRSKEIIKNFKPDLAIGTGGYVSGPVIRQAAKMGIPTVIHEQNAFPGITTKLLSKSVSEVMLTVKEAADHLDKNIKYTVTGLPVRSDIRKGMTREEAKSKLGFDGGMCIFSFGGSLGAGCINDMAVELISWEQSGELPINHIHGYGRMGSGDFIDRLKSKNVDLSSKRLYISEYINNMDICLAAADLVICRSGANTLAELQSVGRASILIPSPIVAENHQYHNAMVLGKAGAAVVIKQKDVTAQKVIDNVKAFYENPDRLREFSKRAARLNINDTQDRIWNVIKKYIKN